jgi:DNA-binding protein YbaB
MFEQMKMMGALAALMKDKDKLAARAAKLREEMERLRVEGQAGGGAVRVVANGRMKVLSVDVSGPLAAGMATDAATKALAAGLIAEGVNDALSKAQEKLAQAVEREAGELGLPPEMVQGLSRMALGA